MPVCVTVCVLLHVRVCVCEFMNVCVCGLRGVEGG